jgi:transposase-like protein
LKNIYCSFFGHQYEVSKNITYHVKEYKCTHCNSQVTTSGNGSLIPLTPKYKEINSVLSRIHNRRIDRIKQKSISKTKQEAFLDFTPHFS